MNSNDDLLESIRRYQAGEATADEVRRLEESLRSDPRHRADFLAYARLDAALTAAARRQAGAARPATPPGPRAGWRSWRPATAAAAGLLAGVFSASMAWAFAAAQVEPAPERIVSILDEGFEDDAFQPGRGFPTRAGEWSGDLSGRVGEEQGVAPRSGRRMAVLPPHPVRKFSYAVRILDLADYPIGPGEALRRVEAEASFHDVAGDGASRRQIRLGAFAEAPEDVKAVWTRGDMLDSVLLHVGRTVRTQPGARGWSRVRSTMEIPPGARSLVVSIAAAADDDAGPKRSFCLDDVLVRFVVQEVARPVPADPD